MRALLLAVSLASASAGCSAREPERQSTPDSPKRARLQELRSREARVRAEYSPLSAPPWIDVSGADPYRVVAWPDHGGARFIGALRGAKALVTLDAELATLSQLSLRESPTALCAATSTLAFVGSRYAPEITAVALDPDGSARPLADLRLPATSLVDLACDRQALHALVQQPDRIVTFSLSGREISRFDALPGGLRLQRVGPYILESSLFARSLRLLSLDDRGAPLRELATIRHDGPIWALAALEQPDELLIAVSGAEDKALVRTHGEFENIDSYVYLYRYGSSRLERVLALNVGEAGLIVPKAISLAHRAGELVITALSAGSPALLRIRFEQGLAQPPRLERDVVPPGGSDAVFLEPSRVVFSSPLLDAWVDVRPGAVTVHPVKSAEQAEPLVRLGEALFFTDLIAPENSSTGAHSRFSCETCHFEGGVDGRTHFTGRADISVVTKPLFGLANNRPHFSRALDADLSAVAHNEFRVAGAGSGTDPWFTLVGTRAPWLRDLGLDRATFTPVELREALLRFLYAFAHDPNPAGQGRLRFTELEARGAVEFERRCERCHAARLFSDDARSRVARERWAELVLSRRAPLAWASSGYEKTGVVPYLHAQGTRVPSLRRLALKPRYFTNGTAATLDDVLTRFRDSAEQVLHDRGGDGANAAGELRPLDEPTRAALRSFLRLL